MKEFWDKQIARAQKLAEQSGGAQGLLQFYAQLLESQKDIYESFRSRKDWLPSGDLEKDLPAIYEASIGLFETVALHGSAPLAADATVWLKAGDRAFDQMLLEYWRNPSDVQFFAKAILQPYARWLKKTGAKLTDRVVADGERTCPFCGGMPQVSFMQAREGSAESGNRDLICATCLTSWQFRRVVCANCGEERPAMLGYFHSPEFDHIRIEACDTCKHYIKGIDLTRLGFAAPLVDEIYSASLDLWAREHGYTKIELNLVGV
jgi:formate dehydrogenase maturation protein FdhE